MAEKVEKQRVVLSPHPFWGTQPVRKPGINEKEGIIVPQTIEEVRKEPYDLPPGFHWVNVNLEDDEELTEVYEFLRDNYVEDKDAQFRFDYQKDFLKWAMLVPKQFDDWICGIRGGKKNKLFGFISGIPVRMQSRKKECKMTEINFLCVHKKLRTKRMAPILIKEITRRVNS